MPVIGIELTVGKVSDYSNRNPPLLTFDESTPSDTDLGDSSASFDCHLSMALFVKCIDSQGIDPSYLTGMPRIQTFPKHFTVKMRRRERRKED